MGSEYAIGDYGWVMRIAFFCDGPQLRRVVCWSLRSEIDTIGGRIALRLLLVAAGGSGRGRHLCRGSRHDEAGRHDDARHAS